MMRAQRSMKSCLYECTVVHHRFFPRENRFSYRIFMLAIDLDELQALARSIPLLSVNAPNLYSFRENDYMPTGEPVHNASRIPASPAAAGGLKARVLGFLGTHGVEIPGGRILLITLPRVAGYLFNPVSLYFCYDAADRPAAAIAEVTNTFHEMKPYFLGPDALRSKEGTGSFRMKTPKHFYVSPFSDVDVEFEFRLRAPDDGLAVCIDDYELQRRTLTSALMGRRRPLTGTRLAWYSIKYPLVTLRIILLIHMHALQLAMKKVPWFAKAARASDQRDLYRPHPSIAHTPL